MSPSLQAGAVEARPEEIAMIVGILRGALPPGAKVWVFGSRAKKRARRGSDLDLAVDAGRRLSAAEAAALAEAFEESALAYEVDIVDLHAVSESFAALIRSDRLELALEAAS